MYTCINTYNVLARVIWPATFARSAGPPGGQNGRTDINIYINIYIYRKIIAAVRLGGLAPARPIMVRHDPREYEYRYYNTFSVACYISR